MEISRDRYLRRLIDRKRNGRAKVITGPKGCGKTYFLSTIFRNHLISEGVPEDNIIYVSFEGPENRSLRDPLELVRFVRENTSGKGECYVLLDEVQMVDDFEGVMNTFIKDRNLDVYAIGSNSRFLSSDIRSSFRGRGDIVRMYPLSFSEFSSVYSGKDAWAVYARFGGMPAILGMRTPEQKVGYLNDRMSL